MNKDFGAAIPNVGMNEDSRWTKDNTKDTVDQYMIFVDKKLISTGSKQNIEYIALALLEGTYEQDMDAVPEQMISVYKKIPLKIGVFLDE